MTYNFDPDKWYDNDPVLPSWLTDWMAANGVVLWGVADLKGFSTPVDETGRGFPGAVSFVCPMDPFIMDSIKTGPNPAYAREYQEVNERINTLTEGLSVKIRDEGFRALGLAASVRSDTVNIKGDFPHKTAATRAGLGWIGHHCQLVTRKYGPWVRLGTVFIDMDLEGGPSIDRSFCGSCRECVEACPAGALKGDPWYPGISRNLILDAAACDRWKKEHYYQYHKGHNCGICSAVCPYGAKIVQRLSGKR